MANHFLKPTVIAQTALALLQREIVLPSLVWRDAAPSYDGAFGDTVSLRVPGRAKARRMHWRERAEPIVTDDIRETKVDVSLDTHVYHATRITDEELTLDIADFGAQILTPQVRAIAEDLEDQVATEMIHAPYETVLSLDTDRPEDTLADARTALNAENVSFDSRFAVLGSDVENVFWKSDRLVRVDTSGSDSVLRHADIGTLSGFTIYSSNALPADTAIVFQRSAFVLGVRAPIVPDGASYGQSQSYANLAMRWLRDYDAPYLRDRSVVSTFSGTQYVPDVPKDTPAGEVPATDPKQFVRAVKIVLPPEPVTAVAAKTVARKKVA
ncbi:MAG: P22 phage major capsid protein family protein [Stackebrandtia sp.]